MEFSGRLNLEDLARLRSMSPLDRSIVFAPALKASDMLQTLEVIFRRIEQDAAEELANAKTPTI